MHGLPKGKRKVFRRENLIQQVILGSIILACVIYAFIYGNFILKLVAGIAIAIVGVIIVSYYSIEFLTGRGYVIASALNELLYLVLGIPILVIAAGFLPASIYVTFFASGDTAFIKYGIYIIVGIIEILAIAFLITRYLRERKMNLFQYIKYLFDFKARAEEQRKFRERVDEIDHFYDDLHKVSDKISKKMEERAMGFEDFDWKERMGQLGRTVKQVECWNCKALNDEDAQFCNTCSVPLKKE